VPEVVKGVYDPKWGGTGNWVFNTAYAGSLKGMRAYTTRLSDVSELEDWIARGIPVGLSLCYNPAAGRDDGARRPRAPGRSRALAVPSPAARASVLRPARSFGAAGGCRSQRGLPHGDGARIGIGAKGLPFGPSHTTRHAGPHRAVRGVEVTRRAGALPGRRSSGWGRPRG